MKNIGIQKNLSTKAEQASEDFYELEVIANEIAKSHWANTGKQLDDYTLLFMAMAHKIKEMERKN